MTFNLSYLRLDYLYTTTQNETAFDPTDVNDYTTWRLPTWKNPSLASQSLPWRIACA